MQHTAAQAQPSTHLQSQSPHSRLHTDVHTRRPPQTHQPTPTHRPMRTRIHTQAQETRVQAYVRTHTHSATGMCTHKHAYLHRHGLVYLRPHARSQDTRAQTTALAHVSTPVLRHIASAHGGARLGTGSQIHMSTLMHTWAHLVTCTHTSSQISPTWPRTRRSAQSLHTPRGSRHTMVQTHCIFPAQHRDTGGTTRASSPKMNKPSPAPSQAAKMPPRMGPPHTNMCGL